MIREKSRGNFREIDNWRIQIFSKSKSFPYSKGKRFATQSVKAYITIWSKVNIVVMLEQTQMMGKFMRMTMKSFRKRMNRIAAAAAARL